MSSSSFKVLFHIYAAHAIDQNLRSNGCWNADADAGAKRVVVGGRAVAVAGNKTRLWLYDFLIAAVIICAESGAIPRGALRGCVTDSGRDA